ncbi:MAG TPA: phenylalanine--tRNA ligase subunit beta [Jatrophihabitans sp.]|jgi:phenylalanyl-tRNA synthetase beta chain
MRAPVSWLAEYVDLPPGVSPRELADALIRVGLEVEGVESGADGISGPLVVGRVLTFADEPQKNGKTIRWCQVDVGEAEPRGIVCGAHNFAAGDLVVASLPGAVLPGGFAISARKTYGHISDGMICSVRELGIGDDHEGILVLAPDTGAPGDDAVAVLGLREAVLDVAVTTDRGYCLSIRGLAREAAAALDVPFRDVAAALPEADGKAYEVSVDDPVGCDRFSARAVEGLDPGAPSPKWLTSRLQQCGIRAISLAVDVTNYVMLETGQPLHAFDRAKLAGPIGVRRARPGEKLTTLDDVARTLDPTDLVVTDDSGPIALAGVMGGASTEIGAGTDAIVLEAAHWEPGSIARTARRHKLPSEASRRFERDVDPEIAGVALQRCVDLLVEYGGAAAVDGYTVVGTPAPPAPIALAADLAERTAGLPIPTATVVATLEAVGCAVAGDDPLEATPPTWRPDLLLPADLVEEIVRLVGYETIPSVLPRPHAGTGLTPGQTMRRAVSRVLAAAGLAEVLASPFLGEPALDALGLAADDPRRAALRLVNPLSDAEPLLRTTLLPGLFQVALRNLGRGERDLALVETGLVFRKDPNAAPAPVPSIAQRPSDDEIAVIYDAVPDQPRHVAAVFCGDVERRGWATTARAADWTDAVEAARTVARAARAELTVRAGDTAPWHPGRCAELVLDGVVVGHAGELHPRVVAAVGLPERTCAMELDLDAFAPPGPAPAPQISAFPPVLLDVALVVGATVPSADVLAALRDGVGPLLESVRLFDVYRDEQRLGPALVSLAFELRLRASDRTLTLDEATAARDSAITLAAERTGARLRA